MEKVLLDNISVKDFWELITIFENVLKQCKATQILISNDLFNRMLKANNNSIIWGEDVLDSLHYNDKVEKAFLFYVGNDSQKQMLQMHFTGNCSDYMQLTYFATKGIIYRHYLNGMKRILIVNSD